MKTKLIAAVVVAAGICASPAFAECDAAQEAAVTQAVAAQAQQAAQPMLPQGQATFDVDRCMGGGRAFDVDFTYKVKAGGEIYWVKGRAQGIDARVERIEVVRTSANLKNATQMAGR